MTPYRISAEPPGRPVIDAEMKEACRFLLEWRKYKPLIAGGALWAWAADERPRDIDIFLSGGFMLRRKLTKRFGPPMVYPIGEARSAGYFYPVRQARSDRFAGTLELAEQAPAKLDIVYTPFRGPEVLDHFDYAHCMVAFGEGVRIARGAPHYAEGLFEPRHGQHRAVSWMEEKVYQVLWGRPWAPERLGRVMNRLAHHYNNLLMGVP